MDKATVGAHALFILVVMAEDEFILLHSQVWHLVKVWVPEAAALPSLADITYEVPADTVQR